MTNRDNLNAMSNKRLAEMIEDIMFGECGKCPCCVQCRKLAKQGKKESCGKMLYKWLESEATE